MAKAKGRLVPRKVYKLLRHAGIVGFSKRHNVLGLNPIIVSTLYIVLTLALASLSRRIVKLIFGDGDSILKQILLEFIATTELCAACFELIIVADNWGVSAYAIYLFLLTIWWSSRWEDASACPYNPIEDILEGAKDLKSALIVIATQVLAALVTFRYVQILWSMELVETHQGRAFEDCTADLQVDMVTGAIIEAAATCICRLTSRTLSAADLKYGSLFDAFFATMMVVAAFNFSGGYFNPALATSLKLGCDGNTHLEHFVVYWLGATVGSVLSVFLFRIPVVRNLVGRLKGRQEEKED